MKPLMIELFCGLGGASKGAITEGYRTVGFDIERHDYGTGGYPGELVLQDVLTIHGKQFRQAAYIWASPPCQEFSYMAMPWKRAKQIARALRGYGEYPKGYTGSRAIAELTALFDACFRIQREASEAAGRHVPMVVENVRGAQPWVGRAAWSFGSYYLWGDVPALMPRTMRDLKGYGGTWFHNAETGRGNPNRDRNADHRKVPGMNFHDHEKTGKPGRSFQSAAVEAMQSVEACGVKGGDWFSSGEGMSLQRRASSKSPARKAASAMIAEIPYDLSNWVARTFHPRNEAAA